MMELSPFYASTAIFVCALTWYLLGFLYQYRLAKQINLPIFLWPFTESVLYYALNTTPLGKWLVFNMCPKRFRDHAFHATAVWRWNAGYRIHEAYGDVITNVGSGGLQIHVADADICWEITSVRRLPKDAEDYDILRVFGENVVTVSVSSSMHDANMDVVRVMWSDGPVWARHRKYTNRPFSEKNNAIVWREALAQAQGMLRKWESTAGGHPNESGNVPDFQQDVRQLALNVISAASFGVRLSFDREEQQIQTEDEAEDSQNDHFSDKHIPEGNQRNYRDAIAYLSSALILILATSMMFPESVMPWMPGFIRQYYDAKQDVRKYLLKLIAKERTHLASGVTAQQRNNLLSILVQEDDDDKDKINPLTDDEVMGNVFIFLIAGHETSANAMKFALTLLALHPDKLEWLHKKLDEELKGQSDDPSEWPYELFFKLSGSLSIMLETVRLFPPTPVIPKYTGNQPLVLKYNGCLHHIPERQHILLNVTGLHQNPAYWGPDASEYNPARWDPSNKSSYLHRFSEDSLSLGATDTIPGSSILKPKHGAFVPFSEGVRGCLGKKFAQVEFVAVLTVLLRKKRLEVAKLPGESLDDAKTRVWRDLEESCNKNGLAPGVYGIKVLPRSR